MPAAMPFGLLSEGAFELVPTIGLDHVHMRAKDGGETIAQKLLPSLGIQGGV